MCTWLFIFDNAPPIRSWLWSWWFDLDVCLLIYCVLALALYYYACRYPRHRKLISINKIYTGRRNQEFNLRHDWNSLLSDRPDLLFQQISRQLYPEADDFPRYLSLYVKELGLKVQYGVDIGKIRATDLSSKRGYLLTDQHGSVYRCRYVCVNVCPD